MNDTFTLYNLTVSVVGEPKTFVCSHRVGHAFDVIGENLVFGDNNSFSMYALAALLPLIPVKQRKTDENDWISTDDYVHCPDPDCGAQFKISRTDTTQFHHNEVTRVPLKRKNEDS